MWDNERLDAGHCPIEKG